MIAKYLNKKPDIDKTAFIAEGAHLTEQVRIGRHSNIWFNVVARADINKIIIGTRLLEIRDRKKTAKNLFLRT